MSGVEIQYFVGLLAVIFSLSVEGGRISADLAKLVAGAVLILLAVLGVSFIS